MTLTYIRRKKTDLIFTMFQLCLDDVRKPTTLDNLKESRYKGNPDDFVDL